MSNTNYNVTIHEGIPKTTAKEDLETYKGLKKLKSDFNKEMKNIKSSVNNKKFSDAKNSLAKCEGYISEMENLIDKLPDVSTLDHIRVIAPALIGVISSLAMEVFYFKSKRDDLSDRYMNLKNEEGINELEITAADNAKSMLKFKRDNSIIGRNDNKTKEIERDIDQLNKLGEDLNKEKTKIKESISKTEKDMKKLNKKSDVSQLISLGAGVTGMVLSLKPLKHKAKDILNKSKKKLKETKSYIDKIEKMSKAVKESFDETLDSLYEAFTEGTIDEFEYDTLMDHLLS